MIDRILTTSISWLESQSLLRITLLVFAIKLIYLWYFFALTECASPDRILGWLSVSSGDTRSYLEPIKNFFSEGSYYFKNAWGEKAYAGRLPLYGFIYWVLNVVSGGYGYTALALFQILLEAVAIAYITRFLLSEQHYKKTGLAFLVLMTFSAYTSAWSLKIQPESISTSILIILAALYAKRHKNLWLTSLLLLGITLLKPYFGILYVLFIVDLLIRREKMLPKLVVLGLPLFLTLSLWSIRNYYIQKEFIPLTQASSGYAYTKSEKAMRRLAGSIGLGFESWDSKSFGHYMTYRHSDYQVPNFLKTSEANSQLNEIREDYIDLIDEAKGRTNRDITDRDSLLVQRIYHLKEDLNSELPRRVLFSPLLLSYEWIFHSGAYYYPVTLMDRSCGNFFSTLDKLLQSFLYYLVLLSALFGLYFSLKARRRLAIFAFFIVSFLFLFFPTYIRFIELRYFLHAFPFLVFFFAVVFTRITK